MLIMRFYNRESEISFFEVKRQKAKINIPLLIEKSQNLLIGFGGYTSNYFGLSMEEM